MENGISLIDPQNNISIKATILFRFQLLFPNTFSQNIPRRLGYSLGLNAKNEALGISLQERKFETALYKVAKMTYICKKSCQTIERRSRVSYRLFSIAWTIKSGDH